MQDIDVTPSWQQIMPTWFVMLEYHTIRVNKGDQGVAWKNFKKEVMRCAKAADQWNTIGKDAADEVTADKEPKIL